MFYCQQVIFQIKKIIFSSTRNTEDKTDLDNIEEEFEEIRDSIVSIGENYVINGV